MRCQLLSLIDNDNRDEDYNNIVQEKRQHRSLFDGVWEYNDDTFVRLDLQPTLYYRDETSPRDDDESQPLMSSKIIMGHDK